MSSWLQEIHDTGRALANLSRVIDHNLTVNVILMGVFSRTMTSSSRPTLQQLLNTLKSEKEMEEIVRDAEDEDCKIMHVTKKQKHGTVDESEMGHAKGAGDKS
ncbi:hypothetical protein PHMEG_00011317 [Phytophthora megakarya]|uniref:Uncharacterized protein n=1 Tax=Phytophthora megakarya TaxID=4795 RepID=A0A225WE25_9STRA|nr:hypothetical protein PHMEG_00011317 [Phytophthora megakarya]